MTTFKLDTDLYTIEISGAQLQRLIMAMTVLDVIRPSGEDEFGDIGGLLPMLQDANKETLNCFTR